MPWGQALAASLPPREADKQIHLTGTVSRRQPPGCRRWSSFIGGSPPSIGRDRSRERWRAWLAGKNGLQRSQSLNTLLA